MPVLPPTLCLAGLLLAAAAPALGQRHLWTVPGTAGATYRAVHWDAATGTLLATQGHRVVRIDPLRGACAVVLEKPWEVPDPGGSKPGPDLCALALGPDRALWLASKDTHDRFRENRVYRCADPGGTRDTQAVAGKAHSRAFPGDLGDARDAGLKPVALAAGTGGTLFVADDLNGRVYRLSPWPEDRRLAGGYAIEAVAGLGPPLRPWDPEQETFEARNVNVTPVGLAVTTDGTVLVADALHCQVFRMAHRPGAAAGGWILERIAGGTGLRPCASCASHADARDTDLGLPLGLVAGAAGAAYLRTATRIWELTPNPDGTERPRWRSRRVVAPSDRLGAVPDGSPAEWLPTSFFHPEVGWAAGPGGGLLFAVPGQGIRYLGPASGEAALAARVRAYRQARADQDAPLMQEIRDALARMRDAPGNRVFAALGKGSPFPRLPGVLCREIASFVADLGAVRFRAALALAALEADP